MLRTNQKNFEDKELPHESFLTIRQTTKIRNAFANSMSTDKVLQTVPQRNEIKISQGSAIVL